MLVKRAVKKEIITQIDTPEAFREEAEAERQPPLLRALGLAYCWQSLIEAGWFDSFSAIAVAEGGEQGPESADSRNCYA